MYAFALCICLKIFILLIITRETFLIVNTKLKNTHILRFIFAIKDLYICLKIFIRSRVFI